MTEIPINAALLVASALLAIILERTRPFRRFKVPAGTVFSDTLHWLFRVLTRGFDVAIATGSVALLSKITGSTTGYVGPVANWPFWVQLIATFVVLDLVHWLVHYAHHKIPFLWKVHSVHHSTENLYWMAAFRRHFLQEVLFDAAKAFAVVLFGFGTKAAFIYFASRVVFSIPAHANFKASAGWLNYVFVTWETHRWHHSSDPEIRDKNMGLHFALWDMVFGTFYCPKGQVPESLGVTGYPNYPTNFFVQQLVPFFYDQWSADAQSKQEEQSTFVEKEKQDVLPSGA